MTKITYMDPKWTDDRGGNIKPNSWDAGSENPTLFNVAYHFVWELKFKITWSHIKCLQRLILDKASTNGGKYRTNNHDDEDSFSIDESIAVAAASYRYGFKDTLVPLKIFTKSTWFRFYDVCAFLAYCKYSWVRWMFLPQMVASIFLPWYLLFLCIPVQLLVAISIFSSSWKEPDDTSGKQLNFVQYFALQDKFWVRWVWSLVLLFVDYKRVFATYYPEVEHPTSLMARDVEDWGEWS